MRPLLKLPVYKLIQTRQRRKDLVFQVCFIRGHITLFLKYNIIHGFFLTLCPYLLKTARFSPVGLTALLTFHLASLSLKFFTIVALLDVGWRRITPRTLTRSHLCCILHIFNIIYNLVAFNNITSKIVNLFSAR